MADGQKPGLLQKYLEMHRTASHPPGILDPNADRAENKKRLLMEHDCIIWKIHLCGSYQKLRTWEEEASLRLTCQVLYTCQGTFDLLDLHSNLTR